MGADNQAEKIIGRIERMERMQAEIGVLTAERDLWESRTKQGAEIIMANVAEIERHMREKVALAALVSKERAEIERLQNLILGACNIFCNLDAPQWAAEFRSSLESKK